MNSLVATLNSRSNRLYDSGIKEMIEMVHQSGALSFTAGEPSMDLIQTDQIRQALWESLKTPDDLLSYYHDPCGLIPLRDWIVDWMKSDGLLPAGIGSKSLLLTSGSQEGLNLIAESVIDEGDLVITENPSYPEAFLVFAKEGAKLKSVNLDSQGPSPEEIEHIAKRDKIKIFYTTPCFQNPSGSVTSLSRRKEILALAKRYNFLLLEDDPYRHLWFNSPPPPSYISLPENDGRVIYLGSFSKIIAPGIRCGWIVAPDWISKTLLRLRVASHLNLPALIHQGILNYVRESTFFDHLACLREAYEKRRDALIQSLRRYIPPGVFSFSVPEGGFFLWGRAPLLLDSGGFARFAVNEERVGVLSGEIFSFDPKSTAKGTIRLSYAKVTEEEAEEGCLRLARAFSKFAFQKTRDLPAPS